jgi:hypothetical protein
MLYGSAHLYPIDSRGRPQAQAGKIYPSDPTDGYLWDCCHYSTLYLSTDGRRGKVARSIRCCALGFFRARGAGMLSGAADVDRN